MDREVLTGIVTACFDAGEYDRRLNLITGERGLVTVFARGARRQNSRFLSSTSPFTFGRFFVTPGQRTLRLMEADVINYFDSLKHDLSSVAYASYILEFAGFFSRENMEADDTIRLIYLSFRALESEAVEDRLVRRVFEIRTLINEGIYPGVGAGRYSGDFLKTISYIENSPVESLYTFKVSEEVMKELSDYADHLVSLHVDRPLRSEGAINLLLANEGL